MTLLRRLARSWPLLIIAGAVLAAAGAAGASRLEENDAFCTRCHLAPEITYHERAVAALDVEDPFFLPDLAAFHYWEVADFRCIDCHRGDDGVPHRTRVLALAAGDTLTWAFGQPDETVAKGAVPNVDPNNAGWQGPDRYSRTPDILNDGCLKCHQDTLTLIGFENHFHNKLPAARVAFEQTGELNYPDFWPGEAGTDDLLQVEETILTCLDCHRAHVEGFESEYFLDENSVVLPACVQCHVETQQGPVDLVR